RSQTRLVQIQDGSSNTLMFGETLGGEDATQPQDFCYSWMGAGVMPTAFGLPQAGGAQWYTFSSNHIGVVQFCFGDGSVRGLRKGLAQGTADGDLYCYISGTSDGQALDYSSIVP